MQRGMPGPEQTNSQLKEPSENPLEEIEEIELKAG
jgi:hypothetical protein